MIQELKPLLQSSEVSDEDLIHFCQKAQTVEKDRKIAFSKRNVKVNMNSQNQDQQAELGAALSMLTKQVSDLQAQISEMRDKPEQKQQFNRYRVCEQCRIKNVTTVCRHCFVCYELGHQSRNCPALFKHDQQQGNVNRSLRRDCQ